MAMTIPQVALPGTLYRFSLDRSLALAGTVLPLLSRVIALWWKTRSVRIVFSV